VNFKETEIMRILPKNNTEINQTLISDKARFSYDGLKVQRLNTPYIKKEGHLVACDWKEAFQVISSKLKECDSSQLKGILGNSMDSYTSFAAKDLFQRLGSSNLSQETNLVSLNSDLRSGYSLNTSIASIEKADVCLIVGVDTRYEASMLNVRLRKRFLEGNFKVATIGAPSDLTFKVNHLGTSLSTLAKVAEGRHPFSKCLAQAKKPVIIIGGHLLESPDNQVAMNLLSYINKGVPGLQSHCWKGLNILPLGANQVGQMDIGINNTLSISPKVLYLFGADNYEVIPSKDTFIIYQGHHGDINASKADLILPGSAFTEKNAPYVNAEGRPQETQRVFIAPDLAREDWKIIRALSEVCTPSKMPYNTTEALKKRLCQVAPSFCSNDEILSCSFSTFDSSIYSPAVMPRKPLYTKVVDFYKTDSITRASRVMATCSSAYKNISNFI
jgi:NADH dehydrogenase/NADH:ubiquinone oxidoreductase subunit G